MLKNLFLLVFILVFSAQGRAFPEIAFDDKKRKTSHAVFIHHSEASNSTLPRAVKDSNKAATNAHGSAVVHHHYGIDNYEHVVVMHEDGDLNSPVALQELGGRIAAALPALGENTYRVDLRKLPSTVDNAAAYVAEGFALRAYHFSTYKTSKAAWKKVVFIAKDATDAGAFFVSHRKPVVEGVYFARDMSTEPGNVIFPQSFEERVKALFSDVENVQFRTLNAKELEENNMGAHLGVGMGSINPPLLLVIEYFGADRSDAPIALAGKGVTFDTGGISLKGNSGMWGMKSDLSGAGAVAGTLYAIAKQEQKVNVVGLMPLAENMPSERAIRPGDVLQTRQGTSVEIISTDAEGRLLLLDAVRYAQDIYEPKMLLNIATLTGSAGRALSVEYAALITRDWDLSVEMKNIGEISGEHVWPLPLHPNHFNQIASDIADIKNSGAGNPGASIGAAVIGTYVDEDLPWVHLDIAGVDWLTHSTDITPRGAQGWGIRFMTELVTQQAEKE